MRRKTVRQSKQLRRLARRDRFRKEGSPVLRISHARYLARLRHAADVAKWEESL
jgi:hypothetical protein